MRFLFLVLTLMASAAVSAITAQELKSQLDAGDKRALANAEALAKANPKNAEIWTLLARARTQANKGELAVRAAEQAVKLAPNSAQAHLWLGNAYGIQIGNVGMFSQMSMAPKLRDAFESAVKLDPSLIEARSALIEFYLQAPSVVGGGIDKAKAQATAIAKYDRAAGLRAQTRIAMHEQNWSQAIKYGEAGLALKPNDAALRQQVIVLYQEAKRWPEAYAAVKKWTAEAPESNNALYQMGRLAAESGLYLPEGEAALRTYLKMPRQAQDPQPKNAYFRLGQILAHAGKKADAKTTFQTALKLDPKMKEAKDELAKL
jgi:cytochrome c-type biogenesis protein CcmH/NrfG